ADAAAAAKIAALEADLAAEKASKAEALSAAETRLKQIEASAQEAEQRIAAAEAAAAEKPAAVEAAELSSELRAPTPAQADKIEAEARESAVNWLRGQIAALRHEIASTPATEPAKAETPKDDAATAEPATTEQRKEGS
ncbi:MAG: hypothetical protein ACSLFD_00630, partial [Solirubrobacterales bacterium]